MTDRRAFITGLATVPLVVSVIPAIAIAATDSGWRIAVREFNAAASVTTALPDDASDDLFDAVTTDHNEKLQAVKEYPVTTFAMLREKVDLLVKEYGLGEIGAGDEFVHIYADVKRLAGGA